MVGKSCTESPVSRSAPYGNQPFPGAEDLPGFRHPRAVNMKIQEKERQAV
jgi:hypothetical protein